MSKELDKDEFNLEEANDRINKYIKNKKVKPHDVDKMDKYKDLESGSMAGKPFKKWKQW